MPSPPSEGWQIARCPAELQLTPSMVSAEHEPLELMLQLLWIKRTADLHFQPGLHGSLALLPLELQAVHIGVVVGPFAKF